MTAVEIYDKTDLKTGKRLLRRLGKLKKKQKSLPENSKQYKVTQSIKAGHIRGGHAFH